MKHVYKSTLTVFVALFVLVLGACNTSVDEDNTSGTHNTSEETPSTMKKAENPKFKDGEEVIVKADHMEGMKNAEGEVIKSFDTIAYVVTYTPTNGEDKVKDHKWVVQEEIKDAGNDEIPAGSDVVLEADHMEGMKGAEAHIENSEKTTVYMIDYKPTDEDMSMSDKVVKNHKWVTEEELEAK